MPRRLVSLLKVFSAAGFNAVLVEWEDTFPWRVDARFRCETAYSLKDVEAFYAEAQWLDMEVIPLVQCLGHMETPLTPSGYEHLREVPNRSDVLNPLASGARELVQRMVDEVIAVSPPRHVHLGGDEAWSFGTHPATRQFIEQHGRGALYLHHVEPILESLNARGIRPILWHDMMVHWDDDSLRRLAAKADLCVWGYAGHPDSTPHHYNTRHIERFRGAGLTLWCATAYKGGEGQSADVPDIAARQENALAWAEVAARFDMKAIIATAWSRYSTHRPQTIPIDAALDSLFLVGHILRNGRMCETPAAFVETMLAQTGEKERFAACRSAMQKLFDARRRAWHDIPFLREQVVTATQDARRRGSGVEMNWLKSIRAALAQGEAAADEARRAFDGLIHPLWIERYLSERLDPIREELLMLEARIRTLDPAGYQAG